MQFVHYRAGKKVESKQIFIPKGVSTINPSRTWFKETMPKVGASATCWRVSPKGEGKRVHMVYKGPEKVRVGSTTYEAFRLDVRGEGSMWLEKGAVPVKMEMRQGQLTITLLRRPAK